MDLRKPLFVKISQHILEDICTGKYQDILPAEQELAELYGVSRPTVRSALQKLNEENIVTTLHGRGTFIARSQRDYHLRIDKMKGFYQLLVDAGHKVSLKEEGHDRLDKLEADYDLPAAFREGSVHRIRRMLLSDDAPSVYLEEYIPESYLKTWDFDGLPNSIYDITVKLTNHKIKYTLSEFFPVLPPELVLSLFGVSNGVPIFMVKEAHFNMMNNIMVYSQVYINTSNQKVNLAVVRTR